MPLLLGELLPDDVERVLFLDADLLVLDDPTRLLEVDLGGRALAAAVDGAIALCSGRGAFAPGASRASRRSRRTSTPASWRSHPRLARAGRRRPRAAPPVDPRDVGRRFLHQEALNAIAWDDWHELDSRWNVLASHAGRRAMSAAHDHPGIVHFAGRMKPWRGGVAGPTPPVPRRAGRGRAAAPRAGTPSPRPGAERVRPTAPRPAVPARAGAVEAENHLMPKLSVLLPALGGLETVRTALDRWQSQASASGLELIVPCPDGVDTADGLRVVDTARPCSTRRVRAASGNPPPSTSSSPRTVPSGRGWAATILPRLDEGLGRNRLPPRRRRHDRARSQAAFLLGYGEWMAPLETGPTCVLPATRRPAPPPPRSGSETSQSDLLVVGAFLVQRLRVGRRMLVVAEAGMTHYDERRSAGSSSSRRWRSFGALRTAGVDPARVAYAAAFPFLAAAHWRRALAQYRRAGRSNGMRARCLAPAGSSPASGASARRSARSSGRSASRRAHGGARRSRPRRAATTGRRYPPGMDETKPTTNDDVIARLASKGEQAINRIADVPGGSRAPRCTTTSGRASTTSRRRCAASTSRAARREAREGARRAEAGAEAAGAERADAQSRRRVCGQPPGTRTRSASGRPRTAPASFPAARRRAGSGSTSVETLTVAPRSSSAFACGRWVPR